MNATNTNDLISVDEISECIALKLSKALGKLHGDNHDFFLARNIGHKIIASG